MTIIDHTRPTFRMSPETERRILLAEGYAHAFWSHFQKLCPGCTSTAILGSVYGWSSVNTPPCAECMGKMADLPDDTGRLCWRTDNDMLSHCRLLLDK